VWYMVIRSGWSRILLLLLSLDLCVLFINPGNKTKDARTLDILGNAQLLYIYGFDMADSSLLPSFGSSFLSYMIFVGYTTSLLMLLRCVGETPSTTCRLYIRGM